MNNPHVEERFEELKNMLIGLASQDGDMLPLMQEAVKNWKPSDQQYEVGTVLTVGDGIATVSGLEHATYGEILIFSSGIRGMVQELNRDEIGCILFGDDQNILEGEPEEPQAFQWERNTWAGSSMRWGIQLMGKEKFTRRTTVRWKLRPPGLSTASL